MCGSGRVMNGRAWPLCLGWGSRCFGLKLFAQRSSQRWTKWARGAKGKERRVQDGTVGRGRGRERRGREDDDDDDGDGVGGSGGRAGEEEKRSVIALSPSGLSGSGFAPAPDG